MAIRQTLPLIRDTLAADNAFGRLTGMTTEARRAQPRLAKARVDDEQRLVHRAVDGDRGAYAEIVSRYAARIFRIAARFAGTPEAVNDLAETIFVRAWERLDQWDAVDFHLWIYQVAIETCLEHASGPGKHIEAGEYTIDDLVRGPSDRSQAEIVLNRDDIVDVYKQLEKLAPTMRTVIILRALEDMSYRDISSILRQPVSTIDTWMRHGLAALKKPLSKY